MFHRIKVVAFDCDGVLFDSSAANTAYYNQILSRFSLPPLTPAQQAFVHMNTVHESLAQLFREPDMVAAAEQFRRHMHPLPFIRLMTPEPHLHSLLDDLRSGYKTAVATNRVDTMDRVLCEHRLENQFDLIVTAADVARAKPYPDMLLKICDHFTIKPVEMLYIGDSAVDEAAAQAAGVLFAAYRNPDLKAEACIEHLGQVMELLKGKKCTSKTGRKITVSSSNPTG